MLFCVRHGERADRRCDLKIEYEKGFDPPITPDGHSQASITGAFIKDYLDSVGYKAAKCDEKEAGNVVNPLRVKIVSSPFLRCIETAEEIAKQLAVPRIDVDFYLCEMLTLKYFPGGDPLPNLWCTEQLLGRSKKDKKTPPKLYSFSHDSGNGTFEICFNKSQIDMIVKSGSLEAAKIIYKENRGE